MLNRGQITILFLGDLLPLFLIGLLFSIQPINIFQLMFFAVFLIISLIGIYYWRIALKESVKSNRDSRKDKTVIKKVEDRGSIYTIYVVTYISVLPLLSRNIEGFVSFLIILLIVYSLYINSDMLFYNPILALFGYKFYKVEIENISDPTLENNEIYAISKLKIRSNLKNSGQMYKFFSITDYTYYLV